MRIALYKSVENSIVSVDNAGTEDKPRWIETGGSYIRVSEYVEVEFTDLPPEETVSQEVAALNQAGEDLRAKYLNAKAQIDVKISKLMAITHEVAE